MLSSPPQPVRVRAEADTAIIMARFNALSFILKIPKFVGVAPNIGKIILGKVCYKQVIV